MHYNIALLPKKVTNYVTYWFFMESNVLGYITFALLFKYEQGLVVCFKTISLFIANIKAFHTKKCHE